MPIFDRVKFIVCPGPTCNARAALDTDPPATPTPVYCPAEDRHYARPDAPVGWADSAPGRRELETANAALDANHAAREDRKEYARGAAHGAGIDANGRPWGYGLDGNGREMPAHAGAPAAAPLHRFTPPDAPSPSELDAATTAAANRIAGQIWRLMQQRPAPAPVAVVNAAARPAIPPDGSVWTRATGWVYPARP